MTKIDNIKKMLSFLVKLKKYFNLTNHNLFYPRLYLSIYDNNSSLHTYNFYFT